MNDNRLPEFVNNLQRLIDNQELLDEILIHFNPYSGFEFKHGIDETNGELNNKIRRYINFDDGE